MSANELENQPTVAVEDANMEDSAEDAMPDEKSGVYVDPMAPKPTARFKEGDTIHMSGVQNGVMGKFIYKISKSHYSRSKGYFQYQLLVPETGKLHNGGEWFRERDLGMERRR